MSLCTEDEGVITRDLLLQDLISYAVSYSKLKRLLQIESLPIRKPLYISCPRDLLDADSKCQCVGSLHGKADMLPWSLPHVC